MAKGPIQIMSLAVKGNGLIQQLVVRSSLHLDCEMVPRIVVRMAGYAGRSPVRRLVIPYVPFIPARDPTLMTPNEPHAAEELVHVKLQRLRKPQVASEEVDVIGEIMKRGHHRMV